jgi:hypothetical protein
LIRDLPLSFQFGRQLRRPPLGPTPMMMKTPKTATLKPRNHPPMKTSKKDALQATHEWVEYAKEKSQPLTPGHVIELRASLVGLGDEQGLQELATLDRPTLYDRFRLTKFAYLKHETPLLSF